LCVVEPMALELVGLEVCSSIERIVEITSNGAM
jgi:hypothetical protein